MRLSATLAALNVSETDKPSSKEGFHCSIAFLAVLAVCKQQATKEVVPKSVSAPARNTRKANPTPPLAQFFSSPGSSAKGEVRETVRDPPGERSCESPSVLGE
jgi:hypothetical protein